MKIQNIAVPVDETPGAALRVADHLAQGDDATVHLFSASNLRTWASALDVPEAYPTLAGDEEVQADIAARTRRCEALARELSAPTRVRVLSGEREASLLEFLDEATVDLAIMSHDRVGFWSQLFRSDLTGQVARITEVPVLAIGDAEAAERIAHRGIRKMVIGVRDRADAWTGAAYAAALARPSAELYFVHALDPDSAIDQYTLDSMVREAAVPDAQKSFAMIVEGPRHEALLSRADDLGADVIVVGAREHESIGDRLVGTTADRVLRGAEAMSVLLLPSGVRRHVEESRALDLALSGSMPASDPVRLTRA